MVRTRKRLRIEYSISFSIMASSPFLTAGLRVPPPCLLQHLVRVGQDFLLAALAADEDGPPLDRQLDRHPHGAEGLARAGAEPLCFRETPVFGAELGQVGLHLGLIGP